jgi:hypothetical protein
MDSPLALLILACYVLRMAEGKKSKRRRKALLLGLGLDNKDGHTRITKGDNFALFGGSESTHAQMQEKAIKLNEHLKTRGKTLDTVSKNEFLDIAHKLEMPILAREERKALPPSVESEE